MHYKPLRLNVLVLVIQDANQKIETLQKTNADLRAENAALQLQLKARG